MSTNVHLYKERFAYAASGRQLQPDLTVWKAATMEAHFRGGRLLKRKILAYAPALEELQKLFPSAEVLH